MATFDVSASFSPPSNLASSGLCVALDHPNYFNLLISIGITVGIFVSYVPQQIKIIARKSSLGISPWFLLLGTCAGTCSFGNVLLLSTDVVECCQVLSPGKCIAATLGVTQIALQFSMFTIILLLYLIYFPASHRSEYHVALCVFTLALCHFAATLAFGLYFHVTNSYIKFFAGLLGVEATILASCQYLPQIYLTYKLRHAESLSVYTMLMQSPGGFLFALSLSMREGTAWSSWLPYFSSAVFQGILLLMCIYFDYQRRRHGPELYDPLMQEMEDEHRTVFVFDEGSEHFD
ncbi:hypothetical protein V1512DRAFT_250225 [Lipomyces arxii]|uniref:uncharacterized protein n=1 Tax=Lipomyces arxii TaxID=56418 RepID=UPI0034CE4558